MLADRYRLRELSDALHDARKRAASERSKDYCDESRGPDGSETYTRQDRVFKSPRSLSAKLDRDAEGHPVKTVEVPYGVHGRAFLAVCTSCGAVSCGECHDDCPECGGEG